MGEVERWMVKGYDQKTDEDGERGEKEGRGGGEKRQGCGGREKEKVWKKARRKRGGRYGCGGMG